jgi:hypothetical protein
MIDTTIKKIFNKIDINTREKTLVDISSIKKGDYFICQNGITDTPTYIYEATSNAYFSSDAEFVIDCKVKKIL